MNIIEAIKSGKRFRRSGWHALREWVRPMSNMCLSIPVADIIAEDWEVESKEVTITREQFDGAWESVTNYISKTQPFFRLDLAQSMLCEKLGL
jgi:hypothetical protein